MAAVSNTSPLLNLAIVELEDLLRQQYGTVSIPPAVVAELRLDSRRLGVARLKNVLQQGWVQVVALAHPGVATSLREHVDNGEAEAIALALELRPERLLLDELEGRRLAARLGLPVAGVLGVLLRAKSDGALTAVAPVLEDLRARAGFHIAESLSRAVLGAVGEG